METGVAAVGLKEEIFRAQGEKTVHYKLVFRIKLLRGWRIYGADVRKDEGLIVRSFHGKLIARVQKGFPAIPEGGTVYAKGVGFDCTAPGSKICLVDLFDRIRF